MTTLLLRKSIDRSPLRRNLLEKQIPMISSTFFNHDPLGGEGNEA